MASDRDGISDGIERALDLNPGDWDSDRDGLPNSVEFYTGTAPIHPDTAADLVEDGREIGWMTHPLEPDTDGDTYLDGHEVLEGTDPADFGSRIYKGFWPYKPHKDRIQGGVGNVANPGFRMPWMSLVDPYGEVVEAIPRPGPAGEISTSPSPSRMR